MLPSILWLPVLFSESRISTTSATSDTDTPPFNIVLPMLPLANFPVTHSSRRRHSIRRNARRRTSTGSSGILRRRMVSVAAAAAILTSSMLKARKVLAWLNGSMWLEAGQAHKHHGLITDSTIDMARLSVVDRFVSHWRRLTLPNFRLGISSRHQFRSGLCQISHRIHGVCVWIGILYSWSLPYRRSDCANHDIKCDETHNHIRA